MYAIVCVLPEYDPPHIKVWGLVLNKVAALNNESLLAFLSGRPKYCLESSGLHGSSVKPPSLYRIPYTFVIDRS